MKMLTIAVFLTSSLLTFGGELADYHFKHATNKLGDEKKSRSHDAVESTNHGITEIGIERTVCFGTCPAYTFIAKSDGSFRYKGDKYVERTGEFTGIIPVWQFHQLAQFIRDSGYVELEDAYDRTVTDNPTVFTTVVLNGKRKVVCNYANAGPTKLWAIEQLVDDLMRKAQWGGSQKAPALLVIAGVVLFILFVLVPWRWAYAHSRNSGRHRGEKVWQAKAPTRAT